MNHYLNILLESIHAASIVPFGNEPTFHAMRAFGHDMTGAAILAIIGATLGHVFNWWAGRLLLGFEHKGKIRINPERYEQARRLFDTYGIYLLLFAWAPLCNILVVAAGFLNIRMQKALPFVVAGLVVHYLGFGG